MSHIMPTYARQPISFVRGAGSYLYDADGRAYLDALTGIAVCGLGHCHPAITAAISEQAGQLIHSSNLFGIDWQARAADTLCRVTGMDSVFFANSGAEANECALKLARLYAHHQGKRRPKVIVMEHAFHGRTLLSVSATANPKAREGFYTLDDDFVRIPFGDVAAVAALCDDPDICALLVEPIQGEGGLHTPADSFGYLDALAKICADNDWLFMLDEVQTGNGRLGKHFAFLYANSRPDVLTTAKGLGNGFPVGACMVSGRARHLFGAGSHGSTYGGNPLACRVVHTVYELLTPELMDNALQQGNFIKDSLCTRFKDKGLAGRGHGMMIGLALPEHIDPSELVNTARDTHQLIINVTGGNVIRLLPSLNLSHQEALQVVERLEIMLNKIL